MVSGAGDYGWFDRSALENRAQLRAAQLRLQISNPATMRRSDLELLGERHWPQRHHSLLDAQDPGPEVLFLTVANDRFARGWKRCCSVSKRSIQPSQARC